VKVGLVNPAGVGTRKPCMHAIHGFISLACGFVSYRTLDGAVHDCTLYTYHTIRSGTHGLHAACMQRGGLSKRGVDMAAPPGTRPSMFYCMHEAYIFTETR
jgi:hypothetical protein